MVNDFLERDFGIKMQLIIATGKDEWKWKKLVDKIKAASL